MLGKEKEKEKEKTPTQPTLQTIQDTLALLQISMNANRDDVCEEAQKHYEAMKADLKVEMSDLKAELRNVKVSVQTLDGKIDMIQQTLKENEQWKKKVEDKMEKSEQRMDEFENHSNVINRGVDEAITNIELQRASHGLKFQNVHEEKDENLSSKMVEIIGEILQMNPQEAIKEIDEINRVQTSYARKRNLPREVHIKFIRKTLRDDILKWSRDEDLKYKEKEVIILKQVPRRV
ncbi:tropomyosin alpha-1 chain-like [Erythrolamprus reginae]|uniref:tropomyosin alpha-1 chain-like n=1 Tax=Erythrolamprus reginae TaxID=121349 RepID=UPI00396C7BC6